MSELAREGTRSPHFRDFIYNTMGQGSFGAPDRFTWDRWIREHFLYRVELEEVVRTPEFMLQEIQRTGYFEGDCDCVSVFYATIIKTIGYRCRFVAIRFSDPFEFQHVFVEYDNGFQWIRTDVTVPVGTVHVELERMVEYV
jgi:hypothetical protein